MRVTAFSNSKTDQNWQISITSESYKQRSATEGMEAYESVTLTANEESEKVSENAKPVVDIEWKTLQRLSHTRAAKGRTAKWCLHKLKGDFDYGEAVLAVLEDVDCLFLVHIQRQKIDSC